MGLEFPTAGGGVGWLRAPGLVMALRPDPGGR